ncbi:SWIM zinc finger domain-containing protein [Siccirubricoccus sp. G192]|uniref:SWIM zinc finger family protein n=1 Tax=Siccirubricoccus sp. G192 TaxID=2849651 RepID=UPI001C2C41D8|nr:DUF6880 family protein [Siccirubricoccus sp. G192]MBV1797584.1 SWIM zinc finger family protein [Siccirubricoccus sp. G192]
MDKQRRRAAPRFDPAMLRDLAGEAVYARGESYYRSGQVELISDDGQRVRARVAGTEIYRVDLRGRGSRISGECSCPAFTDHGFCKHLVATALAANAMAASGEVVPDRIGTIRAHLRSQGIDRLVGLILDLAERDPVLLDRLDLAAAAAAGNPAELGARCRAALKRALRTGRFVDYAEAGGWTQGVLDVFDQVEPLIGAGQASLVLDLLQEFFARFSTAIENVDDSDGGGSEILERAAALHLAACNAARPDPVVLANALFRLETTEEFGTFQGASDRYGHLLGIAGLAEYRRLAETAGDSLPKTRQRRGGLATEQEEGLARYRLFPILDCFAERDGDIDRRIALREAGLVHAHDHLRLAEFCLAQGREAEALRRAEEAAWLFDDISGEPLLLFLADRHRAAGRLAEAEAVLWPGFERRPSMRLYEAMAKARKAGAAARRALADRAIALVEARLAARKGQAALLRGDMAGLLVEILLREHRLPAAWAAARQHGCAAATWLHLAMASETEAPEDALAVYARLVEQQIGLTSKPGYTEACRLIARMARLRAARGETALHQDYVESLLLRHKAKRSFAAMLREAAATPKPALPARAR